MKTCPFCAETDLQDNAKVCKHCGKDIVKDDVALEIAARSRYSAFSLDVVAFWFCLGFGFFQLFFTDHFWRGLFLVVVALIGRTIRLTIYKKQIIKEMELENPSINLSQAEVEPTTAKTSISDPLPFAPPESLTSEQRQVMEEFSISYDGDKFYFREYRYERLSDAVNYAKLQASKEKPSR